jgi:hypothetical protein
MIDVGEIVLDPDFAQAFTVLRTTGNFVKGKWVAEEPREFPMEGTITMASAKELQKVPEGDRVAGSMSFYSTERLYITNASGSVRRRGGSGVISDKIFWKDEEYKLISVENQSDYGFYHAIGVRTKGD